jgi:hypothetical protein
MTFIWMVLPLVISQEHVAYESDDGPKRRAQARLMHPSRTPDYWSASISDPSRVYS